MTKNKKNLLVFAVILLMSICFVFTACEKLPEYTVTFETGNEAVVEPQTVKSGKKAQKPEDPTMENLVFGGWYKDADCKEEFSFSTKITEDITLFAKWTIDGGGGEVRTNYTITYDYQGGTVFDTTKAVVFGQSYTLVVPTRTGYDFIGWFGLANAKGIKYTSYDGKSISNWSGTSDVTVYAYWYDNDPSKEPYGYGTGKKKAPDFTVYMMDDDTPVKLSDFYGIKPVFISLWSTRDGAG